MTQTNKKEDGSIEVIVCPIHDNTHYCEYKIKEKCNCLCTCTPQANKPPEWWEEEFKNKFGGFLTLGLHNTVVQNTGVVHINSYPDIVEFIRKVAATVKKQTEEKMIEKIKRISTCTQCTDEKCTNRCLERNDFKKKLLSALLSPKAKENEK